MHFFLLFHTHHHRPITGGDVAVGHSVAPSLISDTPFFLPFFPYFSSFSPSYPSLPNFSFTPTLTPAATHCHLPCRRCRSTLLMMPTIAPPPFLIFFLNNFLKTNNKGCWMRQKEVSFKKNSKKDQNPHLLGHF